MKRIPVLKGRAAATGQPVRTDRDALRALADQADLLGADPDGSCWLLIRTTKELIDFLAEVDKETADMEDTREDDEDNHDREYDFSDLEDDRCEDQPDFGHPTFASASDMAAQSKAERWIKQARKKRARR